jgi:hypothetical protein
MKTAIDDLVSMRDIESLFELMDESKDWWDQMDAAEGLIQLGDRRGLEYLLVAKQSDIKDVRDAAKEILAEPVIIRMREQIEAEQRYASQKLVESAKVRLKSGKKVFLHKVVYLPAGALMQNDEDESSDGNKGFDVYELNDAGLEGWEVVNVIAHRQMNGPGESATAGVYVFLKRELGSDEAAELDRS